MAAKTPWRSLLDRTGWPIRASCARCGVGDALLPDFVLVRRMDSADAVGAALLDHLGVALPEDAAGLYAKVPGRTVASWRQRFAHQAEELWVRLLALAVEWGATASLGPVADQSGSGHAVSAMGQLWRAARRRGTEVPPAFKLANLVLGNQLLGTRVDLPWPIDFSRLGRSRGP